MWVSLAEVDNGRQLDLSRGKKGIFVSYYVEFNQFLQLRYVKQGENKLAGELPINPPSQCPNFKLNVSLSLMLLKP